MIKQINKRSLQMGAALMTGIVMSTTEAHANNFSSIASNITKSVSSVPGMLTGLSYMFGILIGVLGILKIKDHVENPNQTPLKDGAIRLAAGGGLFALPIVYEAMLETIGNNGAGVQAALLNAVDFNVG
jgi:hypothetical protein